MLDLKPMFQIPGPKQKKKFIKTRNQ